MTRFDPADEHRMRQALRLAERGRGHTRPNPTVGAVIVKESTVLATGYHHQAGKDHAEIDALRKVGMRAPGATLYVTLEPCSHQGRTGPCTLALKSAGIRRVVVGCLDENPRVAGRGIKHLRSDGIQVDVGCLKDECRNRNLPFFTWVTKNRPFVTLKVAATLDGFIGDGQDKRRATRHRWITDEAARAHAQSVRAENDAILVGVGTILADDPRLTLRVPSGRRFPLQRIILDSHLRCDPSAKVFHQTGLPQPWIIATQPKTGVRAFTARRRTLEKMGVHVFPVSSDTQGRPRIFDALNCLAQREIQSLLVEGGSQVHGAFIHAGAVDRVLAYYAPALVGQGIPIASGTGPGFASPLRLSPLKATPLGRDLLISAEVIGKSSQKRGT